MPLLMLSFVYQPFYSVLGTLEAGARRERATETRDSLYFVHAIIHSLSTEPIKDEDRMQ